MPSRNALIFHVRLMTLVLGFVLFLVATAWKIPPMATFLGVALAFGVWILLETATDALLARETVRATGRYMVSFGFNLLFFFVLLTILLQFRFDTRGLIVGVSALPLGAIFGAVLARVRTVQKNDFHN